MAKRKRKIDKRLDARRRGYHALVAADKTHGGAGYTMPGSQSTKTR